MTGFPGRSLAAIAGLMMTFTVPVAASAQDRDWRSTARTVITPPPAPSAIAVSTDDPIYPFVVADRDKALQAAIAKRNEREGAVLIGNPAAGVKLVEYLSMTCSHCADFFSQSKATVTDLWVRNGSVLVETRPAVRDPFDRAAWMVALCGGPSRFQRIAGDILAGQGVWTSAGQAYAKVNLAALEAMTPGAQAWALIRGSGLDKIGVRGGLSAKALFACMKDGTQLRTLMNMSDSTWTKISATPAFEINGKVIRETTWTKLEPLLRAAGAK